MISRRTALVASAAFLTTAVTGQLGRAAVSGHYRRGRMRLPSGCVLSYCEFGEPSGPLVFYFHGTPGSCIEAGLIEEEACQTGVRLIAIDRPGIGSSRYQPQRRILDWPQQVVQLADCLGYSDSSFGIIGLSGVHLTPRPVPIEFPRGLRMWPSFRGTPHQDVPEFVRGLLIIRSSFSAITLAWDGWE